MTKVILLGPDEKPDEVSGETDGGKSVKEIARENLRLLGPR